MSREDEETREIDQMVCEKDQATRQTTGKIELKRELGLFSAVSIILAVMIGKMQLLTKNFDLSRICAIVINVIAQPDEIASHSFAILIRAVYFVAVDRIPLWWYREFVWKILRAARRNV